MHLFITLSISWRSKTQGVVKFTGLEISGMEYITYDLLSWTFFQFEMDDQYGMRHIIGRGDKRTSKYVSLSNFD